MFTVTVPLEGTLISPFKGDPSDPIDANCARTLIASYLDADTDSVFIQLHDRDWRLGTATALVTVHPTNQEARLKPLMLAAVGQALDETLEQWRTRLGCRAYNDRRT